MVSPPLPPLHGVRVLEIGAFMAAPFAGMQLADLGADVVKVENPSSGGDPVRQTGPFVDGYSSPFLRLNRNKRSVGVDLKSSAGVAVLRRLLAEADVLVENLRPGALARLGFDYGTVSELNPGIVYVSASGWGQDGPLADQAGMDIMAQARSGLMSITGTPGGDPVKVGVPMCDLVCGLYGAMATVAALRTREHGGTGQFVDVSLFEAGASFLVWEAGAYFGAGEVGQRHGSAHQNNAPYQAVRTRDGWVTVGATTDKTWRALCAALGLSELAVDERFATAYDRYRQRDVVIAEVERASRELSTDDVVDLLVGAGVPCAPIADTGQVFGDEHLHTREFFWQASHADVGSVTQLGSPMRFSETPAWRGAAGPGLGEHTVEVLSAAGMDPAEIERLRQGGVVATGD